MKITTIASLFMNWTVAQPETKWHWIDVLRGVEWDYVQETIRKAEHHSDYTYNHDNLLLIKKIVATNILARVEAMKNYQERHQRFHGWESQFVAESRKKTIEMLGHEI